MAALKALGIDTTQWRVGLTLVLARREVLDEADRRRAKALRKFAVTVQCSARRLLAVQDLKAKQTLFQRHVSAARVQGSVRCAGVRAKYVRMLKIARAAEDVEAGRLTAKAAAERAAADQAAQDREREREEQRRAEVRAASSESGAPEHATPRTALATSRMYADRTGQP